MTMKLRNRLIALVCLMIFLTLGAALFFGTGRNKPFAVILFVTDNLDPSSLTATRIFSGGGVSRLQFEDFPQVALCRNAANDFAVPDGASASTAIASGVRANRRCLGTAPDGAKLSNILEDAAAKGRSTGLLTAGPLTAPTAAAYYAKTADSADRKEILNQFVNHTPYDLTACLWEESPEAPAAALKPLSDKGSVIVRTVQELDSRPFWKKDPILAILPASGLSSGKAGEVVQDGGSLSDLVRIAIRNLQSNRRGYLLVVDDPLVGIRASGNDAEAMFGEILALDQAVATARRYAGANALVLVTGRQSLGGPVMNGYPFLRDKGISVIAMNNEGSPSICWATGPGFAPDQSVPAKGQKNLPDRIGILSQPSAFTQPVASGTAADVLCFGAGQGSERLRGFLDLTDIHRTISDAL